MAAEKRTALVVTRWLKEAVGRDRTLTNDPQEEEELRGRAERFFSHLFVDFPSLTRLMLLHAGDAPLKCLICPRRRFGSLRKLRQHAHRGTRREVLSARVLRRSGARACLATSTRRATPTTLRRAELRACASLAIPLGWDSEPQLQCHMFRKSVPLRDPLVV